MIMSRSKFTVLTSFLTTLCASSFVGLVVTAPNLSSAATMTGELESSSRAEPAPNQKITDTLESVRLQRVRALTHTKTRSALDTELRAEQKLVAQRALCDAELRSHSIPSACFWVLKREKELHLIHAVGEFRDSQWLEHLCVSRTTSIRDLDDLSLQPIDDVPLKCRSAIQSRIADLRYQFETSAPEKLFRQHYQQPELSHED